MQRFDYDIKYTTVNYCITQEIMDIKRFISSNIFDNDYNKLIQNEIEAIKHKQTDKQSDKTKCIYKVSELDFLLLNTQIQDIVESTDIKTFESFVKQNVLREKVIIYSGPMIKKYLDPNLKNEDIKNKLQVQNYYVVNIIDSRFKVKDIFLEEYKDKLVSEKGYFVVTAGDTVFYVDKKTALNLSTSILSKSDTLDRIALYNNDLWVSGMFILDLYKNMSCYDVTKVDPVFGFPVDVFSIYDRSVIEKVSIKTLIDMVDNESIQKIDTQLIETSFIQENDYKYTVIEYLMMKMVDSDVHSVILYNMRMMMLYLMNFTYIRPPFLVAKMLGFDRTNPALYEELLAIKHKIVVDPLVDVSTLSTVYHIDMFIINHLIKMDNDDLFVDYITKIGIGKKFKHESKTVEKIIDWLVEYRSMKIITTLIDCMVLSDKHRYRVIFLTQEFTLLGKEFITRYVLKKPYETKKSKSSKKKSMKSIRLNKNIETVDKTDVTERNCKTDSVSDTSYHDNIVNVEEKNIDSDNSTIEDVDVDTASVETVKNTSEMKYELSTEQQYMLLDVLPDIINRGLTRAFYLVLKLLPYITSGDFYNLFCRYRKQRENITFNGNILHMIDNDKAVDILEIIIKKNHNLIDDKDEKGRTPLVLYAELGLEQLVKKILDLGADYELTDNTSETFLHKLCRNGNHDIVHGTVRKTLSVIDVKNDMLMTPAHIAAQNRHEEIFYILKGLGADLDIQDMYGNTVYHYICSSRICPGLLIVNKKNHFGFTPYDYRKIDSSFYYFQN